MLTKTKLENIKYILNRYRQKSDGSCPACGEKNASDCPFYQEMLKCIDEEIKHADED